MSRTIAYLLALVLGLAGLGAVAGSAAAAPGDGYITGTVTGTGNQPLADAWVNASVWDPAIDEWDPLAPVRTNAAGQYQLGPLVAGTYEIYVEADSGSYTMGFLPVIVLAPGQTVTGQNIQLALGGSISGTVTDSAGNDVSSTYVQAWRWEPDGGYWTQSSSGVANQGEYELTQLDAGRYRIEFKPNDLMPEFWTNGATLESAKDITVTAGRTTSGINAVLEDGAALSGTVTRATDAANLANIRVTAYRYNSATKVWDERSHATSTGGGSYRISGLAPGTYRLGFWDPGYVYTTEYWPAAASLETASSFTVATDDLVDKDMALSTDPFPAVTNVTAPTILGTAQVGQTLTAATGSWTPATGLTFTYHWLVGGRVVYGATSSTYVPTGGVGKFVQVVVEAAQTGHTTDFGLSKSTAPLIPGVVTNTGPPSISGVPRVGTTVTASPGTWSPGDATAGYQWLVDGQPVAGATSSAYAAMPADLGRSLSVRVTGSKERWTSAATTSSATTVVAGALTATVKPKVSGKAKKKATLKVSAGRWSPVAAQVKLQWYAGTKAIRKATTAKLKLVGKTLKKVRKKTISVRVTVSAPGYTTVVTTLKIRGKVR